MPLPSPRILSTTMTIAFVSLGLIAGGCHTVMDRPAKLGEFDLARLAASETDGSDEAETQSVAAEIQQARWSASIRAPSINATGDIPGRTDVLSEVVQLSPAGDVIPTVRTVSLAEAIAMAMNNRDFVLDNANFLSPANPLLNNPQAMRSRFDLDLIRSSQNSVAAALADFDAQLSSGVQWGRNSVIQPNGNYLDQRLLVTDNGTFYGRLDKPLRTGGTVSVYHNLNYASQPVLVSNFGNDPRFTGYVRGEFRHPLLSGRGREFTDTAGPQSYRSRRQGNGVSLAEITEQTAAIDVELGLHRIQQQTERLYWDLWLAEQIERNHRTSVQNAEAILLRVKNRARSGLSGGGVADEAQAQEHYYVRKSLAQQSQVELQQAADRLKHGIDAQHDSHVMLLPGDEPTGIQVAYDSESSVANGLSNRLELVKQDLQIQGIKKQLFVAQQLRRPQLDVVSGVQMNGLGDDLFETDAGALSDLLQGDDVGWNVGLEFSMPLGFRREQLNERHLKLLLHKAMFASHRQKEEVRQEIRHTNQTLQKWQAAHALAQQRLAASQLRHSAVNAEFDAGRSSLDVLLRALDSIALARIEVAKTLAEVAKAQLEFLYRQGLVCASCEFAPTDAPSKN